MGPINLRYHVISLAAVFLAMGVGIIVGSNTNFFGFSSLIERQERVISRLEGNYKDIRKEINVTKTDLLTERQYRKDMEEAVIPRLLAGKLDGLRVGVVVIGQTVEGTNGEEPFVARLKTAGAVVGYKMNITLQRLDEMSTAAGGAFISGLASELVAGAATGSNFTGALFKEGLVPQGGFEQPVGAVLFYINDDQDLHLMRQLLAPLEEAIAAGDGFVLNAGANENDAYRNIFRGRNLHYYSGIAVLKGQVEVISTMSEIYMQKKELKKDGA